MAVTSRPTSGARRTTGLVLLAFPVVALVCVPIYARDDPRLLGVPFFYWYQLVWVGLSMVFMALAALLLPLAPTTRSNHPTDPQRTTQSGGPQ